VQAREIARVDPTGARTWLFSRANPEGMRVRDIVLVRQRTGEPFAGVVLRKCYNRLNSSFMLRNTLLGVGVEREFKLYSPGVAGIEIVQRAARKPKQKRIYYMRYVLGLPLTQGTTANVLVGTRSMILVRLTVLCSNTSGRRQD
jgi:ribosomal protein L19